MSLKRICRQCKKPHASTRKVCVSCERLKGIGDRERLRQENWLMRRGWLPR